MEKSTAITKIVKAVVGQHDHVIKVDRLMYIIAASPHQHDL